MYSCNLILHLIQRNAVLSYFSIKPYILDMQNNHHKEMDALLRITVCLLKLYIMGKKIITIFVRIKGLLNLQVIYDLSQLQ